MLFYFSKSQAQTCGYQENTDRSINANNIQATLGNRGEIFNGNREPGFAVPYELGSEIKHTIYSAGLWIGAYNSDGNVKLAASTYGASNNEYDYFPGPLFNGEASIDSLACVDFNFIWQVNRQDILSFLDDFNDNGRIDNVIPQNIRRWPAKGNPISITNGQPIRLPNQDLAPFFDRNENGLYEPRLGDYPIIGDDLPNVIPDQLFWCVFNDAGNLHTATRGDLLQVEVHLTAWAFNCSDNDILNETIFTRYKIINKGTESLDNLKIAMWIDPDLGCYEDDYLGCDTILNTAYFYNGDNLDGNEDSNCSLARRSSYGVNPPVQTFTVLNENMSSFIYHTNYGPPGTTTPKNAISFYNYLSGSWADGSPLNATSDGFHDGEAPITKFAFHGSLNDAMSWSMYNENFDGSMDVKCVTAVHYDELFVPYDYKILDFAHVFHRGEGLNHIQNVDYALERTKSLQAFYDEKFDGICGQIEFCESDCIYPGDSNQDGIANGLDMLELGVGIRKRQEGTPRMNTTANWVPQKGEDWENATNGGINYKHVDANGDGILNNLDGIALLKNWRLENESSNPTIYSSLTEDAPINLTISFTENGVMDYNNWILTPPHKRRSSVSITLNTNQLSSGIHGISGRIKLPNQYIYVPSSNGSSLLYPRIVSGTFLGDQNPNFNHITIDNNYVDFAFTQASSNPYLANREIFSLMFLIDEDITTTNEDGTLTLPITFEELAAVDTSGQLLPLQVKLANIIMTNVPYKPAGPDIVEGLSSLEVRNSSNSDFQINPNPSNGLINISSPLLVPDAIYFVDLIDINGRIFSRTIQSNPSKLFVLDFSEIVKSSQMYFFRIRDEKGRLVGEQKVIFQY